MCRVGKISVSVMTTMHPDDSLKTVMHASNQTLLWNVLPLMMQVLQECMWGGGVVDSSGFKSGEMHVL